jgi:hypothetical protein
MSRAFVVALLLWFAASAPVHAQPAKSLPTEVTALSERFFTMLKGGSATDAMHFAFKDVEAAMGSAAIDATASQVSAGLKTFGGVIDWSPAGTSYLTPNLIQQIYFVRCQNLPLFFTIQFYNPGSGWRVIDMKFTTYNEGKAAGYLDALESSQPK